MKRICFIIVFLASIILLICSCDSFGKRKALELCQKETIQSDILQENAMDNLLKFLRPKTNFAMLGLDYKTSTWNDFANKIAELFPSVRFYWEVQNTKTKNLYHVRFMNYNGSLF